MTNNRPAQVTPTSQLRQADAIGRHGIRAVIPFHQETTMPSNRSRPTAFILSIIVLSGAAIYLMQNSPTPAPSRPGAAETNPLDTKDSPQPIGPSVTSSPASRLRDTARFSKRVPNTATQARPIDEKSALPVMPPLDEPLAEAVDDLRTRAEAGDPEATCRLLLDMGACQENQRRQRMREAMTQRAAQADNEFQRSRAIDFLAVSDDASDRWGKFCAGAPSLPFADMERLLEQAVPNMSNRQRLLFTMSKEDGSLIRLPRTMRDVSSHYSSDGGIIAQFHADNDLDALEQGIVEADPLALEGKILLHMPTSIAKKMFDLRETLPDPFRFSAYAMMMERLYGREALGELASQTLEGIVPNMDTATREDLLQQVDTEVARWQHASTIRPKSAPAPDERRSGSLCVD